MGSTASPSPITDKRTKDESNHQLQFGMCEMQGWRPYMVYNQVTKEDATISIIDDENSLFGIFDGHGGI